MSRNVAWKHASSKTTTKISRPRCAHPYILWENGHRTHVQSANAEFTEYVLAAANGRYMYCVHKDMTDFFENEEDVVVKKGKSKQGAKAQKLA